FAHVADDVGLRDRLAVADRKGPIVVGFSAVLLRNESPARDMRQRIEDPRIANATSPDLFRHHACLRIHRYHRPRAPPRVSTRADGIAFSCGSTNDAEV